MLASVVCAFTSPDDLNLIISKVTRIEIHRVRHDGLEGVVDVPIYGRVVALKVCNRSGAPVPHPRCRALWSSTYRLSVQLPG